MTKAPTPTEQSKKHGDNIKNATKIKFRIAISLCILKTLRINIVITSGHL